MNGRDEHLSRDQIEGLLLKDHDAQRSEGLSDSELGKVREHLATCEACQERLRMYARTEENLAGLRLNPGGNRGADCPPETEWLRMAAGLTTEEAEKRLEHAAHCDHCGPLLRQATEDFIDESTGEIGRAHV